jgi:hypothetical protein
VPSKGFSAQVGRAHRAKKSPLKAKFVKDSIAAGVLLSPSDYAFFDVKVPVKDEPHSQSPDMNTTPRISAVKIQRPPALPIKKAEEVEKVIKTEDAQLSLSRVKAHPKKVSFSSAHDLVKPRNRAVTAPSISKSSGESRRGSLRSPSPPIAKPKANARGRFPYTQIERDYFEAYAQHVLRKDPATSQTQIAKALAHKVCFMFPYFRVW